MILGGTQMPTFPRAWQPPSALQTLAQGAAECRWECGHLGGAEGPRARCAPQCGGVGEACFTPEMKRTELLRTQQAFQVHPVRIKRGRQVL